MMPRFPVSANADYVNKCGSRWAHGVNWQREVLTTLEEFCLGKHYRHHHGCAFVLGRRRMRMAANESVSAEPAPIHACELRVD
jgi:hypothetical protein